MANSNYKVVPEAKEALNKFKYEVANEVGVTLKDGYLIKEGYNSDW